MSEIGPQNYVFTAPDFREAKNVYDKHKEISLPNERRQYVLQIVETICQPLTAYDYGDTITCLQMAHHLLEGRQKAQEKFPLEEGLDVIVDLILKSFFHSCRNRLIRNSVMSYYSAIREERDLRIEA